MSMVFNSFSWYASVRDNMIIGFNKEKEIVAKVAFILFFFLFQDNGYPVEGKDSNL